LSEPQPNDAEELLREIEATRERIARTASALAYRADMPMRLRDTVREKLALASATAKPYAARVRSIAIDAAVLGRFALARAGRLAAARAAALAQTRADLLAQARAAGLEQTRTGASALTPTGASALTRAGASALTRAGGSALTRAGNSALGRASQGVLRDAIVLRLPKGTPGILTRAPDGQLGVVLGALGAGFVIGLLLPGKARTQ